MLPEITARKKEKERNGPKKEESKVSLVERRDYYMASAECQMNMAVLVGNVTECQVPSEMQFQRKLLHAIFQDTSTHKKPGKT